jgi:DNA-binding transcriptional regulator YbjK
MKFHTKCHTPAQKRSVAALEELVSRDKHRLAQAQTVIDLFTGARGREPANAEELTQFVMEEKAAGRLPPGPDQAERRQPSQAATRGKPIARSADDLQPKAVALLRLIVEMGKPEVDIRDLAAAAGNSSEGSFDRRLTGLRKRGLIDRRNRRAWATEAGRIIVGAQT